MNEELTPEDYKLKILKTRFSERVSEYEDMIATLLTQRAQLEQRVQELEGEKSDGATDVEG